MDIKEMIENALSKLTGDKALMEEFHKNPVKTLEDKLGIHIPEEQLSAVVEGIKAKLTLDKASGLIGALGGLFNK